MKMSQPIKESQIDTRLIYDFVKRTLNQKTDEDVVYQLCRLLEQIAQKYQLDTGQHIND